MAPKSKRKRKFKRVNSRMFGYGHIQQIVAERIDDGGVAVMADTLEIILIVLVDMAVTPCSAGDTCPSHPERFGKTRYAPDRCRRPDCSAGEWVSRISMPPLRQSLKRRRLTRCAHLLFGILVDTSSYSAWSRRGRGCGGRCTCTRPDLRCTCSPSGGCFGVSVVVVAADIEDRRGGEAGEKGKIAGGQIAAGQHQLHAFQLALVQMLPERRFRLIGEQQNLHRLTPLLAARMPCSGDKTLGDVVQLVHRGNAADDIVRRGNPCG